MDKCLARPRRTAFRRDTTQLTSLEHPAADFRYSFREDGRLPL